MTALAILSFNTQGRALPEKYKKTFLKGLKWLIESPVDIKKFHAYPLGIMAFALGDAYKFYEIDGLETKLKECLRLIIDGQDERGAFNYNYKSAELRQDFSFSSWQFEALAMAKKKGLEINGLDSSIEKSVNLLSSIIKNNYNFPYSSANYNFEEIRFMAARSFRGMYNYLSLTKGKKLPDKYLKDLREFDLQKENKKENRYEMFSVYYFAYNSFLLSMNSKDNYEKSLKFFEKLKQEDGTWKSSFDMSLRVENDIKIFTSYHVIRTLSLPYLVPDK